MSFGSETGRTRSGTKGVSGKASKKLKRKKQEFHTHRGHLQESEHLNPEQVRARTVLGLDRLGHQVLSNEPGGYDLEAWLRSLNSLLDDFEEKMGRERVTDEFRERRRKALVSLAAPPSSDDIDAEIRKLTEEEAAASGLLSDIDRQASARLASLREQKEACKRGLKLEKEKLAGVKAAKESRQFFSRLVRSAPSTAEAEERVADLESRLKGLEDEIGRSEKARTGQDNDSLGGMKPERLEAQKRLEGIQKRLLELQIANQGRLQLAREREIATKVISDAISSVNIDETPSIENEGRGP